MSSLPDPLVPAEVDLRDFPFMPLEITRLFGSDFHSRASDAEWRGAVTLWLKSWHQVPASSLPDDDISLCRLAELGRDMKGWKKIREAALYAWVKCSDGRLYHPVVAEKALEAWIEKLVQRKKSVAGNAKRWGSEFDKEAIREEIVDSVLRLRSLNSASKTLTKKTLLSALTESHEDEERSPTGTDKPEGKKSHKDRKGSEEKGRDLKPTISVDTAAANSGGGNPVDNSPPPALVEKLLTSGWDRDELDRAVGLAKAIRAREGSLQPIGEKLLTTLRPEAQHKATDWTKNWPGIVEHGARHGLREEDFEHPQHFRTAVLQAEGIVP